MSELDLNMIEVIPCAGSNNDDGDSAIVPRIILEDDNREKIDIEGTQDILAFFSKHKIDNDNTIEAEGVEGILNNLVAPDWTTHLSSIFRYGKGQCLSPASKATKPESSSSHQPIILCNYENNQFCTLVREKLCKEFTNATR